MDASLQRRLQQSQKATLLLIVLIIVYFPINKPQIFLIFNPELVKCPRIPVTNIQSFPEDWIVYHLYI